MCGLRSWVKVLAQTWREKRVSERMAERRTRVRAPVQMKREATEATTDGTDFSCSMRTNDQAVTVETEPKDIEDPGGALTVGAADSSWLWSHV